MNLDAFRDGTKRYSIAVFLESADFESKRGELEQLGGRPNVKMVVQPCPFEGIEFLYRVAVELPGQLVSIDREVYWHALVLEGATPDERFAEISEQHYEYLLAILEQDASRVARARKALESLTQGYSAH